jgi:hypothetical protein
MSESAASRPADPAARRFVDLRANCLAAVVMLLLEFGLGMWVNLYGHLPASDHGRSTFGAFGRAVANGPVGLSLHAVLGTLLLVTGIGAVVRAVLTGRRPIIALNGVALLAILAAWGSGAKFVGDMANSASLTMALATGVALLCYSIVLFLAPRPLPRTDITA